MTAGNGDGAAAAELADEVRRRVAQRRQAGEYPPELEQRLARHFEQVSLHRQDYDSLQPLRQAVSELTELSQFRLEEVDVRSRLAVGERYHELLGRTITRHLHPLVAQLQAYVTGVQRVLERLLERLDDPGSHTHADLLGQINSLVDRLGRLEGAPSEPAAEMAALRERVTALEAKVEVRPWYDASRFEQRFGPIGKSFDLGGLQPVAALDADSGLAPLDEADDASLGAVTVADGIERIPRQAVVDLPVLARAKLRAGGQLLVAGTDPASPAAQAWAATDPRWRGPIHPDLLDFLCRAAGFAEVELLDAPPSGYVVRARS
jgi:hypothetical protein